MILAAHQPQYLSYPGIFDKMDRADVFVFLDNVQYVKNGWLNRNRLRTREGWILVTLPVHSKHPSRICEVVPVQSDWIIKHRKTISQLYSRSKYLERLSGFWSVLDEAQNASLAVINYRSTLEIAKVLGIKPVTVLESELNLSAEECITADLRLITLCKKLGCDTYLAGKSGKNYMDLNVWEKHGIQVNRQDFQLEPYKQLFPGWVENLSTVDLLLCLPDPLDHIRRSRSSKDERLKEDSANLPSIVQ
jgi:WbqC-like protein family